MPIAELGTGAALDLLSRIARIRDSIAQIETERTDPPDRLERFWQRQAARAGVPHVRPPTEEQSRLEEEISKLTSCKYLRGVSLPVREKVSDAVEAWAQTQNPPPGDTAFLERFAVTAALLTHPEDVIRLLTVQVPRRLRHRS